MSSCLSIRGGRGQLHSVGLQALHIHVGRGQVAPVRPHAVCARFRRLRRGTLRLLAPRPCERVHAARERLRLESKRVGAGATSRQLWEQGAGGVGSGRAGEGDTPEDSAGKSRGQERKAWKQERAQRPACDFGRQGARRARQRYIAQERPSGVRSSGSLTRRAAGPTALNSAWSGSGSGRFRMPLCADCAQYLQAHGCYLCLRAARSSRALGAIAKASHVSTCSCHDGVSGLGGS